jgi:hypothetical protein
MEVMGMLSASLTLNKTLDLHLFITNAELNLIACH